MSVTHRCVQTTWLEDARQHSNSNMVIMLIGNKRSVNDATNFASFLLLNLKYSPGINLKYRQTWFDRILAAVSPQ
jgi:hypothetical protein